MRDDVDMSHLGRKELLFIFIKRGDADDADGASALLFSLENFN